MDHDDAFFKIVFRLRGVPHKIKTLDDVANLVAKSLGDISAHHVRVFSLATDLGFGNSSLSKVATVMFATIPSRVLDYKSNQEWDIPIQVPEPGNYLVLDTHFSGMTIMNDVDHLSHMYDCIAISGLASHPFGSWQPKVGDRAFMWIRDALPKHIYGIRAVIYGYETKLAKSRSFERIKDLASKLITFLTTYGWGSRSSKPVIFLAHSLGGLVLRDALRQIVDGPSAEYGTLLDNLRGALFFGVPNLGMEQASFLAIAQGNPNDTLIDDIGRTSDYIREIEVFRRLSGITAAEEAKFLSATFSVIEALAGEIQMIQEERESLMYMQRLEPFLISMKQFAEFSEGSGVAFGLPNPMAYGPMEYILRAVTLYPDEFNYILDAYQIIGEQIPKLELYREQLASNQHLKHVISLIYSDVLWFHRELLQHLTKREWKALFLSTWGDFATCLDQISENIARNHRLIKSNVSYKDLEEIQNIRASSIQTFKTNKTAQDISRRATIMQWLFSYNCELDQARHRKMRSICKTPGAWLLRDSRFKEWSSTEFCSSPILWLNGIPGAGKTILASIVIDHLQVIPGAAVAYFYCKHGNESRNSFISVARAILAQLLRQRPYLTSYFFEKASTNGHVLLDSTSTARDMIQTALNSCSETYIVIDGVDECGRVHRDEIVEVFRTAIEGMPEEAIGSVRCLFVSQDDDNARRNFRDLPTIKIINESRDDLRDFAEKRHLALEAKFGPLRSKDCHISNILTARARGMFIFADLFAKYLEAQLNRAALLTELDASKLPVNLDHVYERILVRVFETRDSSTVASVRQILGWIACVRRPLKWAELQGAVCVDLDNQVVDHDKMLSDSPKGLFASLVEIKEDDTVELVHETAREYLYKHAINFREVNYSLAAVSIGYLTLPQLDINEQQQQEDVYINLANGMYSFYDYASACWFMHLQEGISELKMGSELTQLLETLETFIELHWSPTHKALHDLKRVRNSLDSIKASKSFEKITHAVGWAKRQSSKYGQGPSEDEALDLWRVTKKIRSVPFLCYISGCHMEVFGYATSNELKRHLLKYHGIDLSDQTSDDEFPDPPKRKVANTAENEATHTCTECDKKFTRKHNLQNHMRSHQGLKPYACKDCGEKFTRKSDCDRHQRGQHGEKEFVCVGSLKDGGTWGCNKAFGRLDKLVAHLRSRTGQRCIKPHLEEKMRENGADGVGNDAKLFGDQTGENATALRAAGKSLPSFEEFLQLCGLDPPATKPETKASSSVLRIQNFDSEAMCFAGRRNNVAAQAEREGAWQCNYMGNAPIQFSNSPPEASVVPRDASCKDGPDPNDDSDDIYESLSSTTWSLDETHPLAAFKADAIQAVFQGYMEYRKKNTNGEFKSH
ncbi:hypothetical protein GQX73_g157 [Xylaria multiplex]|uniref:C2H2-type domain-containing protein n=1 Tax=Xylaria multiplex TaxID=323545 RepID=A0A7C8J048_9PEZI|nr:hypothetical protein GQX73_g157 [Xylaria multiplex]